MKKIILLYTIVISTLTSCGPSKPLTPQEQAELNTKIVLYTKILESKSFALEANTVFSKKGRAFNMNPTLNFISLQNGEGTLQLSFNQIVGWNGVGGITLEGKVRNYSVIKGDETKMPSVKFDMNGTTGWSTVYITVNSVGSARATVDGAFGDRITFAGPLVPSSKSSIYKGATTY